MSNYIDKINARFLDPLVTGYEMNGDHEAFVDAEIRLTYKDLYANCCRLAGALRDLGLHPGERIAVLMANSHRFLELFLTVPACGFVFVPLNTRHTTEELAYILRDAEPRCLFTDRDVSDLDGLVDIVIHCPEDYERHLRGAEMIDLNSVPAPSPDTLAGLFYTGGTTGKSKGVMLTHGALLENAKYVLMSQVYKKDDRFGLITPMFHSGGNIWLLPILWSGGCIVSLSTFDTELALEVLEHEQITRTFGITTMIARMAEAQIRSPRKLSHLRDLGHAGQPCPNGVLQRIVQAFPDVAIWTAYGTTETTGCTLILREDESILLQSGDRRLGSCGQPAIGCSAVWVLREDGTRARAKEIGEICVRAENLMSSYWKKPSETAEAFKFGWYHTGDLGYANDDNYIFLVDRKKDMIISGGENVYSTEVEEALYRHPEVLEAAVFGIPDTEWGEAVHAVVVLRSAVSETDLRAFCKERIAGYKVPKHITIQSTPLPKSGPGKILKSELRKHFWLGHDKNIN